MEKIIEKRNIEQTVMKFVAFDGKEFDDEWYCKQYEYETRLKEALETVENNVEAEDIRPCNGEENMESHRYYWFRPKSEADVALLQETFGSCAAYNEDIGSWICIEVYDGDSWSSSLKDSIEYVKKLLGMFGLKVSVEEVEK